MTSQCPETPSLPISILVVDDEPDMEAMVRQMFRSRVRRGQYLLSFAGDGVEALAHVDSGADVDVVVTDINMPRMTGLEFLAALRERQCDAKTIVVSAYGDIGNIRTAMNLGAFDFVTKPVDFDDLEATVERTQRYVTTCRHASHARKPVHEAKFARAVQEAIVPPPALWDRRFSADARFVPGTEFCGDFVDIVRLEDARVGLLAARPPGRGMVCAMAMMNARSVFKGAAIGERAAHAVLARANEMLGSDPAGGVEAEAVYAIYDPVERTVQCARAGRAAVFVSSSQGPFTLVETPEAPAVGTVPGVVYSPSVHPVGPGDVLLVCSRAPEPSACIAAQRISLSSSHCLDALAHGFAPPGVDFACVVLAPAR